jgi:hypothetical protein
MYTTTQHADTAMSLQSLVNVIDVLYVAGITFAQHAFISKYTWNTALNLNRFVTSILGMKPEFLVDGQLIDTDIQMDQ